MFAFTFIGLSDTVVQPASWGFEGVDTMANAWTVIGSSHTETSTNDTHNSGTISVTLGSISMAHAGYEVTTMQAGKIGVILSGEFS